MTNRQPDPQGGLFLEVPRAHVHEQALPGVQVSTVGGAALRIGTRWAHAAGGEEVDLLAAWAMATERHHRQRGVCVEEEVETQVTTSMAALQEVEWAHGVGKEVTQAAPHRNSRVLTQTVDQLRAQTEPEVWVGVSATDAEASFAAETSRRGSGALAQGYKRRRLGERKEVPAWFEAVTSDVPSQYRRGGRQQRTWCWWRQC